MGECATWIEKWLCPARLGTDFPRRGKPSGWVQIFRGAENVLLEFHCKTRNSHLNPNRSRLASLFRQLSECDEEPSEHKYAGVDMQVCR